MKAIQIREPSGDYIFQWNPGLVDLVMDIRKGSSTFDL